MHLPWGHLVAGFLACVVLGWIVTHAPMVPYNVRELPNPSHPYLALVILTAFVYWSFGVPALVAHRKIAMPPMVWLLPALILAHAWVAWFLLRQGVLPESIHDVVGSPVLGWAWEWERMARFVALFAVLSLQMAGAALVIAAHARSGLAPAIVYWAVASVAMLPLAWWVIVPMAATDNLVELIADSGALWASALLATWLFVIAFTGSTVAAAVARVSRMSALRALVIALVSLPIAWVLLTQGTEAVIVKGRQTYSALQFLLSADRRNLAAGTDLIGRYVVLHVALVGMIGWVQYPFWLYLRRRREV